MQRSGAGILLFMKASPILVFPMQLFQMPFATLRLSVVGVFFSQSGCEECMCPVDYSLLGMR